MTNIEYAKALRELANWVGEHSELTMPEDATINWNHLDSKEEAITFARALGDCKKDYRNTTFVIRRSFSGITLQAVFFRSAVCTRRVVGKKFVPRFVVEGHEADIVEWDCDPIFESR